ncbi:MAG TPA: LysM domain-containing protein [Candidatus Saccharimonadales bacterium]|nr:LysM domain-containing protein [Candidatus Saccharimonadales bacterium]
MLIVSTAAIIAFGLTRHTSDETAPIPSPSTWRNTMRNIVQPLQALNPRRAFSFAVLTTMAIGILLSLVAPAQAHDRHPNRWQAAPPAAPAATAPATTPAPAEVQPACKTHKVQRGDTYGKIARQYGIANWRDVKNLNSLGERSLPIGANVKLPCSTPQASANTVVKTASVQQPAPAPANVTARITNSAGNVRPQTQAAANVVVSNVSGADQIRIGGTRPSAKDPKGHPSGLALDYMVMSNTALGNAIVEYHVANWEKLGVSYVIWRQRILTSPNGAWKPMGDRGSATANHMDHPHVNYRA